ncbi:MAG TPA: alginate lyase family protein [Pyrinomonadaceae bacterium]|nr:alginate lyase family protein [Pyrinomonadaceae bacterium]
MFGTKNADSTLKSAVLQLEKEAQKALKIEIASVVTKEVVPPSGDRHDYMSQAPYFWKNPKTPNGLPYIRKDGERNPEIEKYPDHLLLDKLIDTVEKLSLAYYFTEKEEYAERASQLLRMWFLDAKTKMNPNLEFAQAIPGINTGRGIGIIETRNLTAVIDSIGLLEKSKAWTKNDQKGLEDWFSKYLDWLLTSKNGREEAAAKNNHGTFYDVQIVSFALFTRKNELATKVLETAKLKRIASQIEPDGSQPLELERTKSWDYSVMNLEGLIRLAELGEIAKVDLWNFQTADGRNIRRALEYLIKFKGKEADWKQKQITPLKIEIIYPLIARASKIYRDEKFREIKNSITPKNDFRSILLNP